MGKAIAVSSVVAGEPIGWFAPEYKFISETFAELTDLLLPIKKQSSKTEGVFRAVTGGRIDFWTLENERAGRSRRYKKIFIDEAAFTKANAFDIWERSIEPTLLDFDGECWVMSNTNGIDPENFFWRICNEPQHGFTEFHAPTRNNPHVPLRRPGESDVEHMARRVAAIEKLKREKPPLVFEQEYEAKFIDWRGVAFFDLRKLLVEMNGVEYPKICDTVFATIDTATKTGREHDGTGICFWAYSRAHPHYQLVLLDWEYVQIQGSFLELWVPQMIERGERLAIECHARYGFGRAFIEDKASGSVLLQHGDSRGWPTESIDSKLTSLGKSERAISVSEYVYQNRVKISQFAHDKQLMYKEKTLNHLENQVIGFRVGNKDQVDDDLLDAFCYGVALGLGNEEGF